MESTIIINQADSFRPQSSICSVEYKSRLGTGVIVGLESLEGTWRTLFITSFQVAPLCDPKEVTELKVVFEDITIGKLSFTPNWIKTLWASGANELDVIVIEFSTLAMTIISRTRISRMLSAAPQHNEKVSVFNYNNSGNNEKSQLIMGFGSINSINSKIVEFSAVIKEISLGSPILNSDCKLIGLALMQGVAPNQWIAIDIIEILKSYQDELRRQYENKSDNEVWLERINAIPKNEFKFIGSGGFGKVYKIADSNGSALALKLVEGFGGLGSFKSQTNALKKEYQLVTSLELHPRIIQFFAFVQDEFKDRLIIIMEYLEGGSLSDKIKLIGSLRKCLSLKYLGQIVEGVDFFAF